MRVAFVLVSNQSAEPIDEGEGSERKQLRAVRAQEMRCFVPPPDKLYILIYSCTNIEVLSCTLKYNDVLLQLLSLLNCSAPDSARRERRRGLWVGFEDVGLPATICTRDSRFAIL